MRTIRMLTLAACLAVIGGNATAGGPSEGSWYIAPQVNGLWLDDGWQADDDLGFQLGFGKVINDRWSAEFSLFTSEHETVLSTDKLSLNGWSLGVNRSFYPEANISPYFTFGLGWLESGTGNSEADMFVKYGLGLMKTLGGNASKGSNFSLRGEVYGRRGIETIGGTDDSVDYVAGIGFVYGWGASPKARGPSDSDGDGVIDEQDKCPGTPPGTAVGPDGCELVKDSDGDGVPDDTDRCPGTPPGAKVDATGCELDSDGDGVGDARDECPGTPAGARVDAKGCELDTDGDGVVDSQDKCPDTPKGDRVDAIGCSFREEIKLPGVVFETGSADLKPESIPVLEGAAATLKRYPELTIEVAGHTDSRGSDALNLDLSARRADSVMSYLRDAGVQNTITARGYGERQPVASNNTDDGRQQNRRVVLRVLN